MPNPNVGSNNRSRLYARNAHSAPVCRQLDDYSILFEFMDIEFEYDLELCLSESSGQVVGEEWALDEQCGQKPASNEQRRR